MSEKIYIGTGKIHTFDNGGSKIAFAIPIDDLDKHLANLKAQGENWIRIDICERQSPSEKGQTHYGLLNTWKPESKPGTQATQVSNEPDFDDSDSIPF